jgi:hypothetical protein
MAGHSKRSLAEHGRNNFRPCLPFATLNLAVFPNFLDLPEAYR